MCSALQVADVGEMQQDVHTFWNEFPTALPKAARMQGTMDQTNQDTHAAVNPEQENEKEKGVEATSLAALPAQTLERTKILLFTPTLPVSSPTLKPAASSATTASEHSPFSSKRYTHVVRFALRCNGRKRCAMVM